MPRGDGAKQVTPPSWLDKAFVADALKASDPATDESSVQIVSVAEVCGGYLSETFRVVSRNTVTGATQRDKTTSLIVKIAPNSDGLLKDVIESGVFTKEKIAYSSFLPAVEAALRAVDLDEWQPVWPKFYYQGSTPSDFLVIEDLDASGFRKVDEAVSLDLEQCTVAVRGLARLHAASVALLDDEQYADGLFHQSLIFNEKMLESYESSMADGFGKMLKIFEEYAWFHKYKGKLSDFGLPLLRTTVDVVTKSKVDFRVMLHGDFHRNNMMFRRDGESLQVRVFDFQGMYVGCPAVELQYFLHTSASLEVLRDHVDQLLAEYHVELQRVLRALGRLQQADAYPLDSLRRDFDRFGMVGVYVTFHILPLILDTHMAGQMADMTLETFQEQADDFCQKHCRNERFLRYVEYLIPHFDSKGLFEVKIE
ncbi:uncharacterized protein LOC124593709 [Schistocerca americana]|uniref:uncharacterized protein LOC124593709 n=1 Tax=Schistocerca americana TaxID=7009 RepID=UPI001F4FEEC1|nr:uncharacterized protein LOC124593709 [Schistocerca americana]